MSIGGALTRLLSARTPTLPVAVCRIGLGIAMFGRGLKTARDLYWLQYDPVTVPARIFAWAPRLDTMPEIAFVGGTWIAASIGLIVGYKARLSAAVLLGCIVFLYVVDQSFWAHHMYFLGLMMLLMAFTDSDRALSVRAWLGEGSSDITAWPLLLMKIQLSLVYFFTSIAKMNPIFLSGSVLATQSAFVGVLNDPVALSVLAGVTVAAEFFLSFALWVPRLRVAGVLVGVGLHSLVPVLFGSYAGLIVFTTATLSVYVLFVDSEDLERLRRYGSAVRLSVKSSSS